MDLTEFLLARIAEDEAAVSHWSGCAGPADCSCSGSLGRRNRKVRAECEAKGLIVELHAPGVDSPCVSECYGGDGNGCGTLKALALPYADHPDHRDEWKP